MESFSLKRPMNWVIFLGLLLGTFVFFILGTALAEEAPPLPPFSDVSVGDMHYIAITSLRTDGIISGYDDGTFQADQKINRAEALKMLTIASGVYQEPALTITKTGDEGENIFTDVPSNVWYSNYIKVAKEKGIISGYDDGSFKPEQVVNLAETLRIYLECFPNLIYPNISDFSFTDTPADDWYTKYTALAASRGLLNINGNNEVFPNQELTRGYLAEIIYRMKKFSEGYEFGKATFYGLAVQGHSTASGETFDMNDYTAAHKTLPFGTLVQVTNLANGKSVEVKITDRGPYGPGRVIDLSSGAFKVIASLGAGIINVQYKIIFSPQ